jgi:hypothetical protein
MPRAHPISRYTRASYRRYNTGGGWRWWRCRASSPSALPRLLCRLRVRRLVRQVPVGCFARALARCVALQLPVDEHVRRFAVEDDEMGPRRHGEMVGGSGACARVLAHAARVCAYRLVDAIASCSRSVGGSAARRLRPGALPPTLRRCTQPGVAGAHMPVKRFVPPKSFACIARRRASGSTPTRQRAA